MHFYFFIMMYQVSSLSNAFIFADPPFEQESKLTDKCETQLKVIFQKNVIDEEGMDFNKFTTLLNIFVKLHDYNENEIEYLFIELVGDIDGLMNEEQFVLQTTCVVQKIETQINEYYNRYTHQHKMTIEVLKEALSAFKLDISDERAIELINVERTDAQNISAQAFRNILAKLYIEYTWTREDEQLLMKTFALYESLDPR
ncbi:uncharacterized protein LOC126894565 [Daktulosphaira vitifoliae]|uniref:uncharacterized protein LOC126894565 n=1 Tax=Daktulosphaira vitifoliae TaxID=58002 RepID=UPI0021A9DD62|nr:uncharacterized protein LOC126894565 [Daktulosphaira vitifoliae]XP_050521635.1 uncharacterized protein LOC126894565 [Daktulosphaira vitifoliae]